MEEDSGFSIIRNDGTERKLTKEETADFFQMVQESANYLEKRDGKDAWDAACEELNRTVPGLHLTSLGGYVPVQGYGTYQGEECYFRARYQTAAFSVGTYDKDPADWVNAVARKIPGFHLVDNFNGHVFHRKEAARWLARIARHVPGMRQTASVSGWNAKRKAEMQVVACDAPMERGTSSLPSAW